MAWIAHKKVIYFFFKNEVFRFDTAQLSPGDGLVRSVFLFNIVDIDDDCREDQKYFLYEADLKNLSSFLVVICEDW